MGTLHCSSSEWRKVWCLKGDEDDSGIARKWTWKERGEGMRGRLFFLNITTSIAFSLCLVRPRTKVLLLLLFSHQLPRDGQRSTPCISFTLTLDMDCIIGARGKNIVPLLSCRNSSPFLSFSWFLLEQIVKRKCYDEDKYQVSSCCIGTACNKCD